MVKKRGKGSSAVAGAAQWKIGDLVLAKVKGFPAWPAQVSRAEDFGRQRNPAKVFVVFFGTKQIRFCQHYEISAFNVEARAALHARTLSKCVPLDLKRAVNEICEVADESGEWTVTREQDQDQYQEQSTSDEENDVQSSSNADNIQAAGNSLETRRGNGSNVVVSKPKSGRAKRKRTSVHIDESKNERDSYPTQREWESSCTNSCNSILEAENKGVPLGDKVLTNFAFHEDLDSFDNDDGVLDEDEREKREEQQQEQEHQEQRQEEKQQQQLPPPPRFSWLRQCSRTSSKFRRRSLNFSSIKICQKRKRQIATKRFQRKVVSSDSDDDKDPDYAEGFGDSLEKKPWEPRNVAVKKQRTAWCERKTKADPALDIVSDKHLPLVKRASARIIHEGCCDDKSWQEPKQRRLLRKRCLESNDMQDVTTSSTMEKRQLPLKAEKYRLRSCLMDGVGALPPCKRRQRVLGAMTVCGTEHCEDEEAAKSKADTTSRSRRHLQDGKNSKTDVTLKGMAPPKTSTAVTAKKPKSLKTQVGCKTSRQELLPSRNLLKRRLLRNNPSVEDHDINGDYFNVTHSTSRFYCEDVNRVREAYEAAKEKKQKLASKNTSAPSTSMKYYLALSQSKQNLPVPAMLYSKKLDMHRADALRLNFLSLEKSLKLL